jgi:heat shock protein HslJ
MRNHRALPWVLLAVPLVALPALAQPASDGAAALRGGTWRLERILYNDGKEIRPADGSRYTLQFLPDGRLAGQADANRILSSYTVAGTMLTIGSIASTRVADPPGSIAGAFTKALEQASSFRVNGDRLLVELKVDSGTMTFARAATEPPPSTDAAAIAPLIHECIAFDERGTVTGSTGVNQYRSAANLAQLAEGLLVLSETAITRRAGSPEAMQRETQFVDAMRKARVWKLSGRTLILEGLGKELLVFRRRA